MQFEDAEKANRALQANLSPRYVQLDNYGRWVAGTQYDGLPDWFTGGPEEKPLWERAPCIVYPVVQIAIRSNVDLVFGEGRFPEITARPAEDESDEENGTDEDESSDVDRFISEYHKLSRFKSHCRDAFADAQGCGTAVGLHGHRDGIPFNELVPAKWCTPVLDAHGATISLEIRYPYLDEYKRADGKWALRCLIYRRVIDAARDVTYKPVEASESGTEPTKWVEDPAQAISHNLGFCPVVWYPFMKGASPVNRIDGRPIHELLLDEIRGHDIALSQKHRCALLSEPQPWETGVEEGYNPTGTGRTATLPATEFGGNPERGDFTGERRGSYVMKSAQPARKKGPGWMWSYPDQNTKLGYLAFPDGLLKSMDEHCLDLLTKIEDGLCVVLPKPAQFKFAAAVSGKALDQVKARQYDRCDQYRDDLEDHFLLPSVRMQLRIAERVGPILKVSGIEKVLPVLRGAKPIANDGGTEPKSSPVAA